MNHAKLDELDELANATAKKIADFYSQFYFEGEKISLSLIRAALAKAVAAERARCLAVLRAEHEAAPACVVDQDFLLAKHGSCVSIDCDTFEDAEAVFDWIERLAHDAVEKAIRKDGE